MSIGTDAIRYPAPRVRQKSDIRPIVGWLMLNVGVPTTWNGQECGGTLGEC